MKRRFLACLMTVLAIGAFQPAHGKAKLDLTGAALFSTQDVNFKRTSGNTDEDFNLNDPRISLYLNSDICDDISFYGELQFSNDPSSENANPAGGLNDAIEFTKSFIALKNVSGSGISVRLGVIDIPFGWEWTQRTGNGDNTLNDFITNSMLDINGTDAGVSVCWGGESALMNRVCHATEINGLTFEAAIFNAGGAGLNDGSPSGNAQSRANDDFAWSLRLEAAVRDNLNVLATYYKSDEQNDRTAEIITVGNPIFINALTSAVNLNGLTEAAPATGGGVTGSLGYDREMWELSAKYTYAGGYVLGYYGNIDADTNVSANNREWDYFGLLGKYQVDENLYVAARYTQLEPEYANSGNLGEPSMLSLAAGYKLADGATAKLEYTTFDEDGDAFGSGAAANDGVNNDADQWIAAIAVKF